MHSGLYRQGKITDKYHLSEEIGLGSTSVVYKAIHRETGDFYAVKIINSQEVDENLILKELQLLQQLTHPNIVKVEEFFYTERFYFIVFEWMEGGEVS